jgi:hypothetical protein
MGQLTSFLKQYSFHNRDRTSCSATTKYSAVENMKWLMGQSYSKQVIANDQH